MIIHGEKVSLRPMTVDEIPTFYKWVTQSDGAPFWYGEPYGDPIPTYEKFLEEWNKYYFDGNQPEKGRCFVILVGDRKIGQINYNEINRENNSVELDIIIALAEDKGKGYGSDALTTLAEYLFKNMAIETCEIIPIAENKRAISAYKKAGFKTVKKYVKDGMECIHMELDRGW